MKKILVMLLITEVFVMSSCCQYHRIRTRCKKTGPRLLFVGKFDSDPVGFRPESPTNPVHYGPPGANLEMHGGPNTIKVVNSTELNSKALQLKRLVPEEPPEVKAIVGDFGEAPYRTGVYYIDFHAHGKVIPSGQAAGTVISVLSANKQEALSLNLFGDSYHLCEGNSAVRLDGDYDPNVAHSVHIELNLDTRKYMICIDGNVVAANKTLLNQNFTNLYALRFYIPPARFETMKNTYIVDYIRITK
ncbi:MAG: hypothetical protein GY845_22490 [Planctomycetes bacterium]|nr:hypothetical protein [Planctomycetota bacterium]